MTDSKDEGRREKRSTYHDKPQRLCVLDKPAGDQQAHSQQDGEDSQPVLARPPQRQEEADAQDDACDLARDDVEAAEDEQRPNQRGSQVSSWQRDGAHPTAHVCDAAFMGIEGDGLDAAAGAAGCDGVAEFVECDDEHLVVVVVVSFCCIYLMYIKARKPTLNGHRTHRTYGMFQSSAITTTYAAIIPSVTFCVSVTLKSRFERVAAAGAAAMTARLAIVAKLAMRLESAMGAISSVYIRRSFDRKQCLYSTDVCLRSQRT